MRNKWKSILSVFLALLMVLEISPLKTAAEPQDANATLYIKEVKMFSEEDKSEAEKQGYILLDEDLNRKTAGEPVYMAYKTTADPSEAVYDMKLMNMNGGYKFTSWKMIREQQEESFMLVSLWFTELFSAYYSNYLNKEPMAVHTAETLNMFRVTDQKGEIENPENGLLNQLREYDFLTKTNIMDMLLLCNSSYIDTIIKLLVTGIQGSGKNWLSELSETGPYNSSVNYVSRTSYADTEEELENAAENLLEILKQHAQIYNLMDKTGAFEEPEYDENGNLIEKEYYRPTAEESEILNYCLGLEGYYEEAFAELEQYPYGDGKTLKDFFCSIEKMSRSKVSQLYPLLSVLDKGEYAAFFFGCVPEMILGTRVVSKDQVYTGDELTSDAFAESYTSVVSDAKEEYGIEYVYLFEGVDEALLNSKTNIAFTEEAERHKATTGEMDFFENDLERYEQFQSNMKFIALLGMSCFGIMAISKVSVGVAAMATGAKTLAALGTLAGYKGTFWSILVNIAGGLGITITLAVVAATFLYSICCYYMDYMEENYPDWDKYPIPDYLYDITDFQNHVPVYNMYEAVKLNDTNKPADLNTFEGKQWLVLYVTYDNAGRMRKPIKADDIKVQEKNGETPAGYTPLCEFGEVIAKNLNAYERSDSSNGLYLFYQQDEEIVVESTKTYYVKDIYIQTGYGDADCLEKLQNAGYTPINYNLTPHYLESNTLETKGMYTYIGYKLTTSSSAALRDLRICYGYNASSYINGEITYGEHGTSGKVTLYASKVAAAGTPILADGLLVTESREEVPEGYEPVNLFSGGPAVNINHSQTDFNLFGIGGIYLYFLPETTFTEGPDYLSGIAHFEDHAYSLFKGTKPADVSAFAQDELSRGLEYWFGDTYTLENFDTVFDILKILYSKQFGYEYTHMISEEGEQFEAVLYSSTKNPYRAIYSIEGTNQKNAGQILAYNGKGHTAMVNYHTYVDPDEIISIGVNTNTDRNGLLFLSGNLLGNTHLVKDGENEPETAMKIMDPIEISEIYFACPEVNGEVLAGYHAIKDLYDVNGAEVILTSKKSDRSVKTYLMTNDTVSLPYICNIYATDYAAMFRAYAEETPEIKASVLNRTLALTRLAGAGATHFCAGDFYSCRSLLEQSEISTHLLNGRDTGNVVNFGYSRTASTSAALRDLLLVCEVFGQGDPDKQIYNNGYKYSLLCEIGAWNFTGLEDNYMPRIYLYGSTDSRLGNPITDFVVDTNLFLEGYETVLTKNKMDMMTEIRDLLYLNCTNDDEGMRELCYGLLNGYKPDDYFLHYKREGDPPIERKPYISELCVTYREERYPKATVYTSQLIDSVAGCVLRAGGDGYLPVSERHNGGNLVYKRSADPKDAITDLMLYYGKNAPDTLEVQGTAYDLAGLVSYQEDNPVWLYYTKSETAGNPISHLDFEDAVKQKDTDSVTYSYAKKYGDLSYGLIDDSRYLSIGRRNQISAGTDVPVKIFNNPSTETRISFTGTETGKYISGIFVMDKNTIRQEKLSQGVPSEACRCKDITEEEVYARLKQMGATFVLNNYIQTDKNDDNRIYIGVTRTDTKSRALKDVILYTDLLNSGKPDERISINRKTYYLIAENAEGTELSDPINLLDREDTQDLPGAAIFLYASKTAGEYLYELTLDSNPIVNGTKTVVSQNNMEAFEDLAEQAKAYKKRIEDAPNFQGGEYVKYFTNYTVEGFLYDYCDSINDRYHPEEESIKTWYLHTKNYESQTIEEEKPYIAELFVTFGQSKREAIAELLKYDIDGFIDKDANQDAGGDYVYIGYRRCANETSDMAITDVTICEGKNPNKKKMITKHDTGVTAEYTLAADVDLNKDAGGDWLYLYVTKDPLAGEPLSDLYMTEGRNKTVDKTIDDRVHKTVVKESSDSKVDLNDGAFGDYLYLIQVRNIPVVTDFIEVDITVPPIETETDGTILTEETELTGTMIAAGSFGRLAVLIAIVILFAFSVILWDWWKNR